MWTTDGTASGTHELTGIGGAVSTYPGFTPEDLVAFGGNIIFSGFATTSDIYSNLWLTDGTAAGTHELTGIIGAWSGGIEASNLTAYNGEIVFNGKNATFESGLWVTNGTSGGTHELTNIVGADSTDGIDPQFLTKFDGELIFEGRDENHFEYGAQNLWITNGTAAGTFELTGIANAWEPAYTSSTPITYIQLQPADLTAFGNIVLFNGTDFSGAFGLWVTNGTSAGTHEVTGIVGADPGTNNSPGLDPYDLTVFNGEVLFGGYDTNDHVDLWVTDGTAAGTHALTGISGASSNGIGPSDMTLFGGKVLFSGVGAGGAGLWVTDGTAAGTHVVVSGLAVDHMTVFNGEVLLRRKCPIYTKMNILILSRGESLYSTKRLVEAASERGHNVRVSWALGDRRHGGRYASDQRHRCAFPWPFALRPGRPRCRVGAVA